MAGVMFAGIILVASLVTAALSLWWGALVYTIAIYAVFAIMAASHWSIPVRKNDAWQNLTQLEQYVLHRHRVFFYFPFAAENLGHFCNWARIFGVLWAILCLWKSWYWLSGALAMF